VLPELRFQTPKSNRRPYGSHRFDVWSPKIGRRLTLFGQRSLRAWVAIEADPTIVEFCERPLVVQSQKPSRVIDFWVRRATAAELWLLLRAPEAGGKDEVVSPAFRQWSRKHGLSLCLLPLEKPALSDAQFRNWGTVLRDLAANRRLLKEDLVAGVRVACRDAVALRTLERRFQHHDPILVRTALFRLLHQGVVHAPEFAHASLDPLMRFKAA
jgi:hypothetical protein